MLALASVSAHGVQPAGFHLDESQPLWVALNKFAQQKGFQLLYSMEDVAQAGQSQPLQNCRFADQCLARLLERKGLQYEYVGLDRRRLISIQRSAPASLDTVDIQRLTAISAAAAPMQSMPMRGARIVWTAAELATRKSGLSTVGLAAPNVVQILSPESIEVWRPNALPVEDRIACAPWPMPDGGYFSPHEAVCSGGRSTAEREKTSFCAQALLPAFSHVPPLELRAQPPRSAAFAPIVRPRTLHPSSPRAPPAFA